MFVKLFFYAIILIYNNNTQSPNKIKFNRELIQLLSLYLYIASALKVWNLFTLSQKGRGRSREQFFFKLLDTCGSAATPLASSGSGGCANPQGIIKAALRLLIILLLFNMRHQTFVLLCEVFWGQCEWGRYYLSLTISQKGSITKSLTTNRDWDTSDIINGIP